VRILCLPVKGERGLLNFGSAEIEARRAAPPALFLGKTEHAAADPRPTRRWVDVHPSQLHRFGRSAL
jgi:hypothetical protein